MDFPRKINGLSLFAGIGGIDLALSPWVRTVAYCERDKYAQAVLLSRMAEGKIDNAPIWDDVRTLDGTQFKGSVDIIFGGFPCQNISSAGRGEGLEGDRSSLFGEIVRLAQEIRPTFIFLENVPAIRTRGLPQVIRELAAIRYDCRWGALSAFDVGAPHKRERWFCLANSSSKRRQQIPRSTHEDEGQHAGGSSDDVHEPSGDGQGRGDGIVADSMRDGPPSDEVRCCFGKSHEGGATGEDGCAISKGRQEAFGKERSTREVVANPNLTGLEGRDERDECTAEQSSWKSGGTFPGAWESDAGIRRVAHGVPFRVDRLRALGNSVVPIQVREAFKRLSGLRETDG